MLESASGRRPAVYGQGGEVFVDLIIGDLFRKAPEMKAYLRNFTDVVTEGTVTLSFENDLLLHSFVNLIKASDSCQSFLNDGRFSSFFSW